jgi:hypothetical protein
MSIESPTFWGAQAASLQFAAACREHSIAFVRLAFPSRNSVAIRPVNCRAVQAPRAPRHQNQPHGRTPHRMKTHINPLALIVLLAVASLVSANPTGRTSNAPPGTRDEIERSFRVRPGGVLKFDADLGNAEIFTADTDTVRIEFIREFKVATAAEANVLREKLNVEMGQTDVSGTNADTNGVHVTVRLTDNDRDGENRRKMRLDFRITMPRKFNLDLRTVGSARLGDLDGWTKARTMGGSLKLGNVSGAVTARSEGGSVSIEEASDAIEARAAGGSVTAWISKQPRGDTKITAEAGNIDLRLNESVAVNVDAACTAGRLSSDFSLHGHQVDNPGRLKSAINGGGPLVMLRASAGNINLHK